jgi:diacylglycerol kinase family enzyme
MIVLLNPQAGAGTALEKWLIAEPKVRAIIGPFETIARDSAEAASEAIRQHLDSGETRVVAAGGDGTVNLVASSVARHGARRKIKLGAIGLGSSNDFHKPLNGCRRVVGAPCRLDFGSAASQDVCMLAYEDGAGTIKYRYWVINASAGITAEANALFNDPDRALGWLKRRSPDAAIMYAAIKTIMSYRPRDFTLTVDGHWTVTTRARNLGIVKNPNFAGSLRYDSPFEPDSGEFFVHLLRDVSAPRLVLTLVGLLRGRFVGKKGTRSWRSRRLGVSTSSPFTVELDGEVIMTRYATFSVLPGLLQVCGQ